MDASPAGPRRRRIALTLTALGFGVFAIYVGLWLALIVGGHTDQADYTAFYTGWTIVADGHGADLYDVETQTATQQAILGGRSFEAGLNPSTIRRISSCRSCRWRCSPSTSAISPGGPSRSACWRGWSTGSGRASRPCGRATSDASSSRCRSRRRRS